MTTNDPQPPSLTAAERRWALAAANCSVGVFGLTIRVRIPLLSITGTAGWPPFIANMAVTAAAALPLLGLSNLARDVAHERGGSPLAMLAKAPLILVAVAIFGLYETTLLTLLPVWGVRMGLS